jgi:ArsR family transcriptional regulator
METLSATDAALAHESRLGVFRLLIEPGPKGKHANAIGEQLEMALGTLSFRLAHLSRVGLIQGERESRFIHYSANFATMDDLIAFLTRNCCQREQSLPKAVTCDTADERRSTKKQRRSNEGSWSCIG